MPCSAAHAQSPAKFPPLSILIGALHKLYGRVETFDVFLDAIENKSKFSVFLCHLDQTADQTFQVSEQAAPNWFRLRATEDLSYFICFFCILWFSLPEDLIEQIGFPFKHGTAQSHLFDDVPV